MLNYKEIKKILMTKKSTFTPPILKFIAMSVWNSFSLGSSSYPEKEMWGGQKILDIFILHWFHFPPMVGFLPCLQHACTLPAACPGYLKYIFRL